MGKRIDLTFDDLTGHDDPDADSRARRIEKDHRAPRLVSSKSSTERRRQLNLGAVPESVVTILRDAAYERGFGVSIRLYLLSLAKKDGVEIPDDWLTDRRVK